MIVFITVYDELILSMDDGLLRCRDTHIRLSKFMSRDFCPRELFSAIYSLSKIWITLLLNIWRVFIQKDIHEPISSETP